ncbi:RNA polymerase primary sigma factor [Streptosporangium album]|uniref:RNA polymerase primary sigma factor n=1 Tax=Streptosporangium album TaxID=47479 RepID=A0A7W7RTC6_9ACTN|nr:helix-turn-helix transcriptional regulator [Streptosporangium album]MBB4937850.1 RNA polymerase primary sigma factor [Streptosporangium album]
MDDSNDFGIWLGRQLRRQGMSQAELAQRLDVTRAAVSAWVTGRAVPRLEKIRTIEEILGLMTGSVMTLDEVPDSAGNVVWYHRPAHRDGGRELGNAAAFAFDSDLRVLAREATQNSLDERWDKSREVRVRYTLHEISGERLYRFLDALHWNDLEAHYEAAADRSTKVGRIIANGLQELREKSSLLLLRIDDYNAYGLDGPEYGDGRFAAVVRRQLDSLKSSTAGGSYGLGKATIWAASRLGLVLINSTLAEPHEGRAARRVIGRLDLPWRQVGDDAYAGPSWLGEPDAERGGTACSWWADTETVQSLELTRKSDAPGTSFLIVGAHDGSGEATTLEEMHAALVKGLAESFWASMVSAEKTKPMLEASVVALRDGQVIRPEERVNPDKYEPARSRALRAFYEGSTVDELTSADAVVKTTVRLGLPTLRERPAGGEAQPAEHDAILLLTPTDGEDDAPNKIVCMRSSRMTVMTRTVSDVPMGAPRFQAVLLAGVATGSSASDAYAAEAFLRAAEPPEHNDWKKTDDLTALYARGAVARINDFRTAMLQEARRLVRSSERKSDDGPAALRDLLSLDPPPIQRIPGFPTVRQVEGVIRGDGAWQVRVEIRLPEREDPWVMVPVLRFLTRSGPKPRAQWAEIVPESGCELVDGELLKFTSGGKTAVFTGVSDVTSHPVTAQMALAEVDLMSTKETAS